MVVGLEEATTVGTAVTAEEVDGLEVMGEEAAAEAAMGEEVEEVHDDTCVLSIYSFNIFLSLSNEAHSASALHDNPMSIITFH